MNRIAFFTLAMTAIYAVIRFQISNGAFDGLAELEQFAFFVSQSFVFAAVLDADTLVLLIHATVVRGNGHIFDRNVRQNATLLELFSQNVTIVRIVREAFSLLKYFIVDILDEKIKPHVDLYDPEQIDLFD